MSNYVVAALYQFVSLPHYKELQAPLKELGLAEDIRGTLLLASEGINGTVCGSRQAIDRLKTYLTSLGCFNNLEYKESFCEAQPFVRLKVRLKKEIVTLGIPGIDPTKVVGTYVDSNQWNSLLEDPEVIVLDTRNDYEIKIGSFEGALNPNTRTFRDFPNYVRTHLKDKKNKKIAMFCTGGIRCEKASSFMAQEGFEEVYHLKGGILKYLDTIPKEESHWHGECFVFDERIGVKEQVRVGTHSRCFGCRFPISEIDKQSKLYEEGVTCPNCYHTKTEASKAKARTRHMQHQRAKHCAQHQPISA